MTDFVPPSIAYRTNNSFSKGQEIRYISIQDVAPVRRSIGSFHNGEGLSARERVLRVLSDFLLECAIPPVEIIHAQSGAYLYELTDGTHRLYCSLAAKFTHVPAIAGFDLKMLDR
jgi:hypothetical protein